MSLSRTVLSRFACGSCLKANRTPSRTSPLKLSQCAFSTSPYRGLHKNDLSNQDPEFAFLDDGEKPAASNPDPQSPVAVSTEDVEKTAPTPPVQNASVPWYLKQQQSVQLPVQNPAEIPALPPNPPPLLETLLDYISVTAGLDDLQLLDLRDLDPPPALGPKLIMIIATARSEKHLHVAADRFCRYLRREHGLKANAAGLLGRNELKIKLRRKAKRMRMLANVGGSIPEGNIDDGIRTGWICCTLGKLEAHPEDTHMPGDNVQEFVGFRDVKPGVNVVVQMFTEEKRAETDLETLWGGVVKTHQRKIKTADEALKELEEDIEELEEEDIEETDYEARRPPRGVNKQPTETNRPVTPPTPARQMHRPRPTAGDIFPPAASSDTQRQIRRLHTVGL
jgi:ribosomal silencing factor RsfS